MRLDADKAKLQTFMEAFGKRVGGPGTIYLTGGATALLYGWREKTIDIDIKAEPEPPGFFEAVAELKDTLDTNVELASPDLFIPELPGWRERSLFIQKSGKVEFRHFDFYSQVLAKLERGHERDLHDVLEFKKQRLVEPKKLLELFTQIRPQLKKIPAIDEPSFAKTIEDFCRNP